MNKKYGVVFLSTCFLLSTGAIAQDFFDADLDSDNCAVEYKIGPMSQSAVPTPISNADQVGGVISFAAPGYYKVIESLMYPLVILVSGVTLNLNCYRVTVDTSLANAITVTPQCNKVCIYNGYISGNNGLGFGCGIAVLSGCSKILCRDLKITECPCGVGLFGIDGDEIVGCQLKNIDCLQGVLGIRLEYAHDTLVKGCQAIQNSSIGFIINHGVANNVIKCNAVRAEGLSSVIGFYSDQGHGNLFKDCVTQKTGTSSVNFGDAACGFMLTGTETKTKIIDCVVNDTYATGVSSAVTYGVAMRPVLLPYADMLSEVARFPVQNKSGTNMLGVRQVAWSPQGNYFVEVATPSDYIIIKKFDGQNQTTVCDVNVAGRGPIACAWSPDGKFFAVGFGADPEVSVYAFNGQTATLRASIGTPTYISYAVQWSPNGKFLAASDSNGAVHLFSFDGSTLTYLDSTIFTHPFANGYPMSWSADSSYLCIAPRVTSPGASLIIVPVSTFGKFGSQVTASMASPLENISCSPTGRFIVARDIANNLSVFAWTGSSLSFVTSVSGGTTGLAGVTWSPCGRYVAVGTSSGTVRIYQFTGAGLVFVKEQAVAIDGSGAVFPLAWSPDSRYITATRMDTSNPVSQVILTAMYGPLDCFVDQCIVQDTSAVQGLVGIGYAAGSNCVVTDSSAHNNSVPYAYGIPNVYYGRFNGLRGSIDLGCNIAEPTTL